MNMPKTNEATDTDLSDSSDSPRRKVMGGFSRLAGRGGLFFTEIIYNYGNS